LNKLPNMGRFPYNLVRKYFVETLGLQDQGQSEKNVCTALVRLAFLETRNRTDK
jgi:hypothetical protein